MTADEQVRVWRLGEAPQALSPTVHPLLGIFQDLGKTQGQAIDEREIGSGFPLPPTVIVLRYREHDFRPKAFRIGRAAMMARAPEVAITPVSREIAGDFPVIRLSNQPDLPIRQGFEHGIRDLLGDRQGAPQD
jgi:hypothetical protein